MGSPDTILQIFASRTFGGGERFVCDISRRLADDGRHVVLVSRPSRVLRDRTAGLGMPHYELPLRGIADIVSAVRLARIIAREKPSVVHLHHFKDAFTAILAGRLSRLSGCKDAPRIIVTRHLVRKGKGGWFYRYIYRNINRIVFVSECARKEFLSSRPPVDEARTTVILNSVPDAGISPTAPDLRMKFGIASETPLLLFCGRLCSEKGVHILLQACTRLAKHSLALVIVGTGDAEYIKNLQLTVQSAELDKKVFFYGFSDDVPALMRQADIMAIPSTAPEAGSLVLLEAMQAGCAVVATDGGSQREFIDHQTDGLLVPASDAEALAEALAQLLDDKESRVRLGRTAQEKFRHKMAYDIFYDKYAALYSECCL